MKKFRFTLQALRTLRQREEQLALEQYALAIAARRLAADRLNTAQQHCEAGWQARRQRLASGISAGDLAHMQAHCLTLEELKKECDAALQQTQLIVDEKWEKLIAARQAREAVDKYFARQRLRYDRAWQREEQKTLDDIGQRRVPLAVVVTANPEDRWN